MTTAATQSTASTHADDSVLVIEREFNARRDVVFQAWTDPAEIVQWWGPEGMDVPESSFDMKAGGAWSTAMCNAEGKRYVCSGVFKEISPPEKLVFTWAWVNDGVRGHETIVTVLFEERGDKTLMHFEQRTFQDRQSRDDHNDGWVSSFVCLEQFVG